MDRNYNELVGLTKTQAVRKLGWWWTCEKEEGNKVVMRHKNTQLTITYMDDIVVDIKKITIID